MFRPRPGRVPDRVDRTQRRLVRQDAVAVARLLSWRDVGIRHLAVLRLHIGAGAIATRGLVDRVIAPRAVLLEPPRRGREDDARPSPTPTNTCRVSGGQCTKSHCLSARSCPSTISSASPESTRKSSCSSGSTSRHRTRRIPSTEAVASGSMEPPCVACVHDEPTDGHGHEPRLRLGEVSLADHSRMLRDRPWRSRAGN